MREFIRPKIVPIVLGIFFVNLALVNYHILFRANKPIIQNINLSNPADQNSNDISEAVQEENGILVETKPSSQAAIPADGCGTSCLNAIKSATASLTLSVQKLQQQSSQTGGTAPQITVQETAGAQEFFIPFGAGSGASQGTYSTLPALQAYVNTSNYPNISTITFEVSAQIPNGNQSISIQLYNATDGYAIPNSQVTMSGGTPQLLISPNITLPSGNKLYQVQINTQLNSNINIDQARLHITTN